MSRLQDTRVVRDVSTYTWLLMVTVITNNNLIMLARLSSPSLWLQTLRVTVICPELLTHCWVYSPSWGRNYSHILPSPCLPLCSELVSCSAGGSAQSCPTTCQPPDSRKSASPALRTVIEWEVCDCVVFILK